MTPTSLDVHGAAHWKRTLGAVWVSQFLTMIGFSFALPFAPFFMERDLGVDPARLTLYVTLFAMGAPLSLAIFSPIWGALADRLGRRPMLLRATLGASILLALMGFSRTAGMLLAIRCLQGVLTGSMNAAQALVATQCPARRVGFSLGFLSTAVFSGSMTGAIVGGWFADAFGYRAAFFCSALIELASFMIVWFGVRETFVRRSRPRFRLSPLGAIRPFLPIIGISLFLAFVRHLDQPFLPLFVRDLHGGIEGASGQTGLVLGAAGVAALISGLVFGYLSDRRSPRSMVMVCLMGGAVCMGLHMRARSIETLIVLRFAASLFLSGLDPLFKGLLARVTPSESRAGIFGWDASARSIGWLLAPMLAGTVVGAVGIRWLFLFSSLLLLLALPWMMWVSRWSERQI